MDLGNIWSTQTPAETLPCATPIVKGTTNTANPTCNGFLSYSQVGKSAELHAHGTAPISIKLFQEFRNVRLVRLHQQRQCLPGLSETVNGWTARTGERGSTTGGPTNTKRVSVNADWSGVYSITDKLRILDSFRYDNWRIPGVWDTLDTTVFGTPSPAPGVVGLLLSPGMFNSTSCTAARKL